MIPVIIIIIIVIIVIGLVFKEFPILSWLGSCRDGVHFLYNGNKWFNYRLGDLVLYGKLSSSVLDSVPFIGTSYHSKLFPYSIAAEYEKMGKGTGGTGGTEEYSEKINYLKTIINERIIKDTDFLLHLRIGDVLTKFKHKKHLYFKEDSWWDSLIEYIKKNTIQRVIIMGGCYTNEGIQESVKYIEEKRLFFEKENLKVLYRFANSPDEDLLFVSNAKHYSSTGGGYGQILGDLVKSFGGNVF